MNINIKKEGELHSKLKLQKKEGVKSLTLSGNMNSKDMVAMQRFVFFKRLTKIDLYDTNLTFIVDYAFEDCFSLKTIILPKGLTIIGSKAFSGCLKLSSINIPEGVTTIGNDAFHRCESLEYIVLPESITSISAGTFGRCKKLKKNQLPQSVTSIHSLAFAYCDSLEPFPISSNVSIGYHAFDFCVHK